MWAWLLCFGDFLSALLSGQDHCCTVPAGTGHGFQAFTNFLKQSEHCSLVANWRIAVLYRDPHSPRPLTEYLDSSGEVVLGLRESREVCRSRPWLCGPLWPSHAGLLLHSDLEGLLSEKKFCQEAGLGAASTLTSAVCSPGSKCCILNFGFCL